jgi:hypothetical protein
LGGHGSGQTEPKEAGFSPALPIQQLKMFYRISNVILGEGVLEPSLRRRYACVSFHQTRNRRYSGWRFGGGRCGVAGAVVGALLLPLFPVFTDHGFNPRNPFTLWWFIPSLFKPRVLEARVHNYHREYDPSTISLYVVVIKLVPGFLAENMKPLVNWALIGH